MKGRSAVSLLGLRLLFSLLSPPPPPPVSHTRNVWDPALQYLPPDGPAGEKAMTATSMVLYGPMWLSSGDKNGEVALRE